MFWLVRDYTQSKGVWIEQILPRVKHLRPTVTTNENDLTVTLPNRGRLFLCSEQNVESIRGLGSTIAGGIINEAAHFQDLEYAWKRVVRPILVDLKGWCAFLSTTNRGSFFNDLCQRTERGDAEMLAEGWASFGGDARENSEIDPQEFAQWVASTYLPGSIEEDEEVYGKLLPGGNVQAFPMWVPAVHASPALDAWVPPSHWRITGGMDWGIASEAVVHLLAFGERQQVFVFREWVWTDKDAKEAGQDLADALLAEPLPSWPENIWVDSAMHERTGVGGTTILGEFQAGLDDVLGHTAQRLVAIPAPKGPGSRAQRYNMLRKLLAWEPKLGSLEPRVWPLLRLAPGKCPYLARTIPKLKLKAHAGKDGDLYPEDFVDPDQPHDHPYDSVTYALLSSLPKAQPLVRVVPQDTHPGLLPSGRRRSRVRTPEVEEEEAREEAVFAAQQSGVPMPFGKYGLRRPR